MRYFIAFCFVCCQLVLTARPITGWSMDTTPTVVIIIDSLTVEEEKLFSIIDSLSADFHYSNKVERYYAVSEETGFKNNIRNKIIIEQN